MNFEILLKTPPLKRNQIHVVYNPELYSAKPSLNPSLVSAIANEFLKRKPTNPTLFNTSKFRFDSFRVTTPNHIEFFLGLTDYAQFLGTNRNENEVEIVHQLKREGEIRFNNSSALFAQPLGHAAIVKTMDTEFVFIQRSHTTCDFPGGWDLPGGHPEPSEVSSSICNELFDSIQREVFEELNLIEFGKIGEPELVGIISANASQGKPSLIFELTIQLTSKQVVEQYQSGWNEESTQIALVSLEIIQANSGMVNVYGKSTQQCMDFAQISSHSVPNAQFAFHRFL